MCKRTFTIPSDVELTPADQDYIFELEREGVEIRVNGNLLIIEARLPVYYQDLMLVSHLMGFRLTDIYGMRREFNYDTG